MDETKYWLWMSMVFGIGNPRIWEVVCLFEDVVEAFSSLKDEPDSVPLTAKEKDAVRKLSISAAEEHIAQCEKIGVSLAGYSSSDYPPQLRNIYAPPAVIYYKGNISCLIGTRTITAVGTRKASDYGIETAYRVCSDLAKNGYVIVSGFALGTDITAHMAAVNKERPTAAVLGCGVDVDYPKPNFKYRDKILENGGVFVSEYPPGTPPLSQNFPKRNRILAGLGRAAIVFEASVRSGSLITADLAAEQGREVFCLPPADIFSNAFSGNIELLRSGAAPLYSVMDIMDHYAIGGPVDTEIRDTEYKGISSFAVKDIRPKDDSITLDELKAIVKKVKPRKKQKTETESVSEEAAQEKISIKNDDLRSEMTEIQQSIYDIISEGAVHADIISEKLDLDPSELMTELTELEILGAVRSLPGKMFEIIA